MAKFVGAYHGVFLPFLTDTVTGFGASYPEAFIMKVLKIYQINLQNIYQISYGMIILMEKI